MTENSSSLGRGRLVGSWSPLGDRIAFTVFSYRAHFWRIHPFSLAR